jgi:hypothetical protein
MNSKDRVSLSALLHSLPVPRAWAVTFGFGRDFWANQENGQTEDLQPAPTRTDVRRLFDEFG